MSGKLKNQIRTATRAISRSVGYAKTVYRARNQQNDLPRMLTYTVTFGCNARCIMCDSWKLPTQDDLKLAEIKEIFKQLPPMDVVRLTGGEPLVRIDFTDIANAAIETLRPLVLHVTTNGFLTKRLIQFCESRDQSVPLELLISVDGVGEKHNEIRGTKNAWSSVMKSVEAIAPRRKELNVNVAINQTVVDREGAEHYERLHELLRPMSVPHHLVIAYDTSATYSTERDLNVAPSAPGEFLTFGDFGKDELATLIDKAYEDAATLPWMERIAKRYYLRGIRSRVVGEDSHSNPPCVALNTHLRIFPNGDVPTCQFNSQVVGNLREQSFREVWGSAKADEHRQWVRNCPGCWAECEVMPNAVYSLDLLRPNKRLAAAS